MNARYEIVFYRRTLSRTRRILFVFEFFVLKWSVRPGVGVF